MYELIFSAMVCTPTMGEEPMCEHVDVREPHASPTSCQDRSNELWSEALSRGGHLTYSKCSRAGNESSRKVERYNYRYKDTVFRLSRIHLANFETSLLGYPAMGQLYIRPGRTTRLMLTIKF